MLRSEKLDLIISLHNEGKNIRDIAKTVHMSFSDIGKVIRDNSNDSTYCKKKKLSKVTQALELFSKNKTPIEVAIEIDLDSKYIEKIYLNYLALIGLSQLVKIYQELGNYVSEFISFYWSCREFGADNKKIKEIIDLADRAPELKSEIQRLQFVRKNLEGQIEKKHKKIQDLDSQIKDNTDIVCTQYSNLETTKQEITNYNMQLQNKRKLINDFENEDQYKNLEKKVEEMLLRIIDDKTINLPLNIIAVFEGLRNDPSKDDLIFNYLDTFKNDNINGEELQIKENHVFFKNMALLREIDKIKEDLVKIYSNKIISGVTHFG